MIDAPLTAQPGDLVVLSSEGSVGTARKWSLVGSDKRFLPVNDGREAVFASGTPGRYSFSLAVADGTDGNVTIDVAIHTITIGAVVPDPDDDDPTPVPPTPDTAPFPAPGLSVVIVAEAGEIGNLPAGQRAIFSSGEFIAWLRDATDGRSRIWDDDLDDLGNAPKVMQDAYAVARRDMNGPWVVVSNGKAGVSQALPATMDELKAIVQRYQ